jgi:tetratricopeptide (TPR) repeat protein
VAQALNLALETPKQEQLAERPTENLAAYDAFLKGEEVSQGIWGTTPATLRRAAGYYEQAVALDSTFALAWAQLSRTLSYAYFLGSPTAADAERARFAADRALALAPARAEGRLALGDYYHYVRLDNTPALAQYEQGYQLAPSNPDLLTGAALTDQNLGKWQESVDHLQKSLAVDPRSVLTTRRLAFTLLWLRRYPEALAACDRALALGPANLQSLETKAMVHVAQADIAGARAVIASAPTDVEPTNLVVYLSNYWDLFWILNDEQQALLLRLTPRAFDDDRASWAMVMTQTYALRHDAGRLRAYADTARAAYEEQLKQAPTDAQRTAFHGLALAYLGRYDEAIRDGQRATALVPLATDGYNGPYYQHQLARIYTLAGQPDKALDALEPLLKVPYFVSAGWLKVDPNFASLHGNPRFERLVAGS